MSVHPKSVICDLNEMDKLASSLARRLSPGSVITLQGNLGSGKTTFSQMLCKYLNLSCIISSPTFTYLNIYEDRVAHFDLYRLKNKEHFFALGFEEYLESDYITLIEWPEIIKDSLSDQVIHIEFRHHENKREVLIYETALV